MPAGIINLIREKCTELHYSTYTKDSQNTDKLNCIFTFHTLSQLSSGTIISLVCWKPEMCFLWSVIMTTSLSVQPIFVNFEHYCTKSTPYHLPHFLMFWYFGSPAIIVNPLNAKLNPICHLLALLRAHHIFHVNGIRVKFQVLSKCWLMYC